MGVVYKGGGWVGGIDGMGGMGWQAKGGFSLLLGHRQW